MSTPLPVNAVVYVDAFSCAPHVGLIIGREQKFGGSYLYEIEHMETGKIRRIASGYIKPFTAESFEAYKIKKLAALNKHFTNIEGKMQPA